VSEGEFELALTSGEFKFRLYTPGSATRRLVFALTLPALAFDVARHILGKRITAAIPKPAKTTTTNTSSPTNKGQVRRLVCAPEPGGV